MKKISGAICLALFALVVSPMSVFADNNVSTQNVTMTVNGVALLKVTGADVLLSLSGSTDAGAPITPSAENKSTRLKITSLATATTPARTISVNMIGGDFSLSNTTLTLGLEAPNGAFRNFSAATLLSPVVLGNSAGGNLVTETTAVNIAEGIGTCWSGILPDDGYVIAYKFTADDGKSPENPAPTGITIKYTISNGL